MSELPDFPAHDAHALEIALRLALPRKPRKRRAELERMRDRLSYFRPQEHSGNVRPIRPPSPSMVATIEAASAVLRAVEAELSALDARQ